MCIDPVLFGGEGGTVKSGKPITSKPQHYLATHQPGMKSSGKHSSPSASTSDEEITHVYITSHWFAGMGADYYGFKDYNP